jgi:tRNA(Ile)-lysidine synthase
MAARELRHRFLAETARWLNAAVVAVAHQADDQVELFVLRLLRGAGGEGLAGMKWESVSPVDKRVRIVRPLLDLTKEALKRFAQAKRIPFREDASNASVDILRNRVRHELLPLLRRRFQPGLDRAILRVADILRAEAEVVDEAARAWLTRMPARRQFAQQPIGLQRRILQLQLREQDVDPDFALVELLRSSPGKPVTVLPGWRVQRDEAGRVSRIGQIRAEGFRRSRARVRLGGASGSLEFDETKISWRRVESRGAGPRRKALNREIFDADRVGAHIVLRHWRAGDRFQPIGMRAAVKLQDWFTNRKVPKERRRKLILGTTAAGEIFWVEGERIGERFKLTPETRRRLIWSWKRGQTT